MEAIRKRWKQIAVGSAAVGGLYLLYNRSLCSPVTRSLAISHFNTFSRVVAKFLNFRWREHRQEIEDLAATSGYYVSRKPAKDKDAEESEDLRPVPGSAQDKEPWLERTQLLVGTEALKKLAGSHVLVVGLGGVGSYAAEFIVRAGVGKITIMDGDDVDTTNRNRQLIALTSTERQQKATVLERRLRDINPDLEIHTLHKFLEIEDAESLVQSGNFDYIIDAIDSLQPKLHLMWAALKFKVPIISSMGAGGKLDPEKVFVGDISETEMDPLARFIRVRLKKQFQIQSGIGCVFSTERPCYHAIRATDGSNYKRSFYGTISYTPCLFGLKAAGVVIRELCGTKIIYTKRKRPLLYAGWVAAREVKKVYKGNDNAEDEIDEIAENTGDSPTKNLSTVSDTSDGKKKAGKKEKKTSSAKEGKSTPQHSSEALKGDHSGSRNLQSESSKKGDMDEATTVKTHEEITEQAVAQVDENSAAAPSKVGT